MTPKNAGIGLIEVMVYTALLFLLGLAVAGFVFQLTRFNNRSAASAQALDDARRAVSVLIHEIRHSSSVYSPTSIFGSHPGQLSLETTRQAPAGEDSTYIDFYVDNERLYLKREGAAAQLVTSPRVRVTNAVFTHLAPSVAPSAVRLELTIRLAGAANQSPVTLQATASPRFHE